MGFQKSGFQSNHLFKKEISREEQLTTPDRALDRRIRLTQYFVPLHELPFSAFRQSNSDMSFQLEVPQIRGDGNIRCTSYLSKISFSWEQDLGFLSRVKDQIPNHPGGCLVKWLPSNVSQQNQQHLVYKLQRIFFIIFFWLIPIRIAR